MLPFTCSQHAGGRRLQIQSWICEDAEKAAGNGAQNTGGTEETPVEVVCQYAGKRLPTGDSGKGGTLPRVEWSMYQL